MTIDPRDPGPAVLGFLAARHLATLTTIRPDGAPHVVAVGFTFDDGGPGRPVARVITNEGSRKVANRERAGGTARAAVAQVAGPNWLSLEGPARVSRDPSVIADAVARYARRYQEPRRNPRRVVIEIDVERMLGRADAG